MSNDIMKVVRAAVVEHADAQTFLSKNSASPVDDGASEPQRTGRLTRWARRMAGHDAPEPQSTGRLTRLAQRMAGHDAPEPQSTGRLTRIARHMRGL